MKAYIIEGFLYGQDISGALSLSDRSGKTVYEKLLSVPGYDNPGLGKFVAYEGDQPCLIKPGEWTLVCSGQRIPVVCVGMHRVAVHTADNGKPLTFTDDIYPVIMGEGEGGLVITIKKGDRTNVPKIILDGNSEEVAGKGVVESTYPKAITEDAPYVITGTSGEDIDLTGKCPLFHGDVLEVFSDGDLIRTFIWDQISKIWYEEKDAGTYPTVSIKGGTYLMGDYRGRLYNYSFGMHNVNMKKNWEKIYDPQFMGESAIGEAAVGVSGLKDENSEAANKDSIFWCYNEDAVDLHDVTVSDFEMGTYQVSMDQFYAFVSDLKGDDEKSLYYEISGIKYPIHHIAGIGLYEKRLLPRDNGWGCGSRPAINVSFNEMAEYCNYFSRKKGYEPCYDIQPVYEGEYAEGETEANVFRYLDGSCMQIKASRNERLQLVKISCDLKKNGFRLPTEAEFEYVIRGGEYIDSVRGGKGDMFAGIYVDGTDYNCDVSWQRKNTENPQKSGIPEGDLFHDNMGGNGHTSPVGTRIPSRLGIYDLSGNVWEVMNDIFSRSYFTECAEKGMIKDPTGPDYSPEQLSDMKNVNADKYLLDRYMYSYEKEADGSMKRVSAVSIEASGKTHHVLRGGCYTNPFPFTSALHRHAAGGISYIENFVNHNNARTGFRMVRSKV